MCFSCPSIEGREVTVEEDLANQRIAEDESLPGQSTCASAFSGRRYRMPASVVALTIAFTRTS